MITSICCHSRRRRRRRRVVRWTKYQLKMKRRIFSLSFICLILIILFQFVQAFPSISDVKLFKQNQTQLVQVQYLFRHGDRSPLKPLPFDQVSWNVTYGELTNIGKRQHHKFGEFMNKRYVNSLLNSTFDISEFYIRSTDKDRTLMSAEAHLSGLYPPVTSHDIWMTNMPWQPIPIHTESSYHDQLLNVNSYCPKFSKLLNESFESSLVTNFMRDNQELIQYLEKWTGVPNITYDSFDTISDTLICRKAHNIPLPTWLNESTFNYIYNQSRQFFTVFYANKEMKKLRGGYMLKNFLENMKYHYKKDEKVANSKMIIYSAHDITLAAMYETLDLFDPPFVLPYASAIVFELHKPIGIDDVDKFIVKLFARNDTIDEVSLKPLNIPHCSAPCTVGKLWNSYSDRMPKNIVNECKLLSNEPFSKREFIMMGIIAALFLLIILTIGFCGMTISNKKKKYAPYQPVPNNY
ncbi:hypothetical protein SNEBB_003067 [Seison nebaliae]|nr:hypothetical protein SNEBB_003067 [Seison nebaliae]